jgi:hypothetical protein
MEVRVKDENFYMPRELKLENIGIGVVCIFEGKILSVFDYEDFEGKVLGVLDGYGDDYRRERKKLRVSRRRRLEFIRTGR